MKKTVKKLIVFLLIVCMLTSLSSPYSLSNIAKASLTLNMPAGDGVLIVFEDK